jgi:hypothetical protein
MFGGGFLVLGALLVQFVKEAPVELQNARGSSKKKKECCRL